MVAWWLLFFFFFFFVLGALLLRYLLGGKCEVTMRRASTPLGYPGSEWRLILNGQAQMSDGGKVHGDFSIFFKPCIFTLYCVMGWIWEYSLQLTSLAPYSGSCLCRKPS